MSRRSRVSIWGNAELWKTVGWPKTWSLWFEIFQTSMKLKTVWLTYSNIKSPKRTEPTPSWFNMEPENKCLKKNGMLFLETIIFRCNFLKWLRPRLRSSLRPELEPATPMPVRPDSASQAFAMRRGCWVLGDWDWPCTIYCNTELKNSWCLKLMLCNSMFDMNSLLGYVISHADFSPPPASRTTPPVAKLHTEVPGDVSKDASVAWCSKVQTADNPLRSRYVHLRIKVDDKGNSKHFVAQFSLEELSKLSLEIIGIWATCTMESAEHVYWNHPLGVLKCLTACLSQSKLTSVPLPQWKTSRIKLMSKYDLRNLRMHLYIRPILFYRLLNIRKATLSLLIQWDYVCWCVIMYILHRPIRSEAIPHNKEEPVFKIEILLVIFIEPLGQ